MQLIPADNSGLNALQNSANLWQRQSQIDRLRNQIQFDRAVQSGNQNLMAQLSGDDSFRKTKNVNYTGKTKQTELAGLGERAVGSKQPFEKTTLSDLGVDKPYSEEQAETLVEKLKDDYDLSISGATNKETEEYNSSIKDIRGMIAGKEISKKKGEEWLTEIRTEYNKKFRPTKEAEKLYNQKVQEVLTKTATKSDLSQLAKANKINRQEYDTELKALKGSQSKYDAQRQRIVNQTYQPEYLEGSTTEQADTLVSGTLAKMKGQSISEQIRIATKSSVALENLGKKYRRDFGRYNKLLFASIPKAKGTGKGKLDKMKVYIPGKRDPVHVSKHQGLSAAEDQKYILGQLSEKGYKNLRFDQISTEFASPTGYIEKGKAELNEKGRLALNTKLATLNEKPKGQDKMDEAERFAFHNNLTLRVVDIGTLSKDMRFEDVTELYPNQRGQLIKGDSYDYNEGKVENAYYKANVETPKNEIAGNVYFKKYEASLIKSKIKPAKAYRMAKEATIKEYGKIKIYSKKTNMADGKSTEVNMDNF